MTDPTKVTILIDTERSYLSVAHLIRSESNPAGKVIRVRADTYEKVANAVDQVRKHSLPQWTGGPKMAESDFQNLEIIAIDTLSRLADITRRGIVASTGELSTLWARRETLTPQQRDWGTMTDMLARILEPLSSFCEEEGYRLLLLTHESKRQEEGSAEKKGGPDANAKLLSEIIENSDFVWRVWREETTIKINNVQYPKNTHFLRVTTSEQKITKMRLPPVYSARLMDNYPNPTLQTVFEALGPCKPLMFTIFGPAGSGKTTLACSLSDPANYKNEEPVILDNKKLPAAIEVVNETGGPSTLNLSAVASPPEPASTSEAVSDKPKITMAPAPKRK